MVDRDRLGVVDRDPLAEVRNGSIARIGADSTEPRSQLSWFRPTFPIPSSINIECLLLYIQCPNLGSQIAVSLSIDPITSCFITYFDLAPILL